MFDDLIVAVKEVSVDYRQRTVKEEIDCTGIGLHSGEQVNITIKPAPPDSGITFVRKDLDGHPSIKAHHENVVDTNMSTTIGDNGCTVSTIEHLMAAFFGFGIDNARVELDAPEVPVMDGSSGPFVFLLNNVGIKDQKGSKRFITINKTFKMEEGEK